MEINEAIIKILEDAGIKILFSVKGKVVKVDEDKRTCEVEPDSGEANYVGVRLQALESENTGVLFVPEQGSDVIIHFIDNDESFVVKTSKVSKVEIITEDGDIWLNGDDFGGLIKIEELKKQLQKNTQRIDTIINVLKSTITSVALHPNPGWSAIINPIVSALQKEDYSKIENETVKHG
ncbi:MAG: hypothetical protein L3J56_06970 [Bacteroidales bacterium]|nr:hypothetical protein [Bacteroidales bacterium]